MECWRSRYRRRRSRVHRRCGDVGDGCRQGRGRRHQCRSAAWSAESDLGASERVRESLTEKFGKSKAAVVGPGLGEDDYAEALMRLLFGQRTQRRMGGLGFRKVEEMSVAPEATV